MRLPVDLTASLRGSGCLHHRYFCWESSGTFSSPCSVQESSIVLPQHQLFPSKALARVWRAKKSTRALFKNPRSFSFKSSHSRKSLSSFLTFVKVFDNSLGHISQQSVATRLWARKSQDEWQPFAAKERRVATESELSVLLEEPHLTLLATHYKFNAE